MKHFFALPALLRPALLLAAASQHTFSVQDDLLAFPQYEVKFVDDYVSELDAQSQLSNNDQLDLNPPAGTDNVLQDPPPSDLSQYRTDSSTSDQEKKEQKYSHEYMVLDNQRFLCRIPIVKPSTADTTGRNDTLEKMEEQRELARATDRGWELLSGMQGNCVYFVSGWWSYRFCYGKGVKQFHQIPPGRGVPAYPPVEDPSVNGFELGNYVEDGGKVGEEAKETGWEGGSEVDVSEGAPAEGKGRYTGSGELVQRGESRYLVQRLGGGTKCDLTGKERRIELQFHCNPQSSDRISLIKETSTCAYLMVIQTPRLCNDVAFLPPQKDQPNEISCSPILADEEVEDYEHDLAAIQSITASPSTPAEASGTGSQYAGSMLIGAHTLLPATYTLQKGAIVGGGKETYIDTVASSSGRVLSEEDMKKLGLGDPRAVEKLRKELEKIAKGQNWKLDVIDTPRGREYRGIIGDEEEEGKEGGKGEKEAGDASEQEDEQQGSQEEYYKEEL